MRTILAILAVGILIETAFSGCIEHEKKEEVIPLEDLNKYVNPFIGTAGDHGQLYPGPVRPFGLVRLGPDTVLRNHAGYDYDCDEIKGFSHFRLGGVGCEGEGGNILVTPSIGSVSSSHYNHDDEEAQPGYYAVSLKDCNIQVELTATQHVGFHKYTFPASTKPLIQIDAGSTFTKYYEAWARVDGNNIVEGYALTGNFGGEDAMYPLYFYTVFSKPFQSYSNEGDGKIVLKFTTFQDEVIMLKVGLSLISVEQAQLNLETELSHWDFEKVKKEAKEDWNRLLNRIVVESESNEFKTIFYTALYRSLLIPINTTDVNGKYLGFDENIHVAKNHTHYDTYSLWDTFRTKHPLLTLVYPQMKRDMVVSLTDAYEEGGWMPRWPVMNKYTWGMIGDHATPVIVDTYIKGITDFDVEKSYEGIKKNAMEPGGIREELSDYKDLGYVPMKPDFTMEYAYDDWCLAQMAKALGKTEDYEYFMKRARNYANTWDSDHGLFWYLNGRYDRVYGFPNGRYRRGFWSWKEDPEKMEIDCTEGSL